MTDVRPALVAQRIYDYVPVPARWCGGVLFSDQLYHRHSGRRRYFWLPDEGVQLVYEPFGWTGEWYIDLVSFRRDDDGPQPLFTVVDRYVDIVVEGMGPTYRMLDLDEAAQALLTGALPAADLAATLEQAQRFVDAYLHRGAEFPPPAIAALGSATHDYPEWSDEPVRLRSASPAG